MSMRRVWAVLASVALSWPALAAAPPAARPTTPPPASHAAVARRGSVGGPAPSKGLTGTPVRRRP